MQRGLSTLLMLTSLACPMAMAQDLRAPVTASLTLTTAEGERIATPFPGEPFLIDVALTDAVTGTAPKGIVLEGWIRPIAETDLPCTEAARAFRTTRRIPKGGIDLNGVLLASFHTDGTFGIADPRLDLATANMLAAGSLDAIPHLVAADRARQRLIVHLAGEDALRAILTTGEVVDLPSEVNVTELADMVVADKGGIWLGGVGDEGNILALVDGEGGKVAEHAFAGPILGLAKTGEDDVFAWSGMSLAFFDAATGALRAKGKALPAIRQAAGAAIDDGRGGVTRIAAMLGPDRETGYISFGDALESPVAIELAAPSDFAAVDPETGLVLFWNRAGSLSLVDPALGRLSAAVSLEVEIGAIAFAGEAAFLLTPDQSGVIVIDLTSVVPGQAPLLRETRLAPRNDKAVKADVSGLLLPLTPSPQVLAVNVETYTGFIIDESSSMGDAPPMTAVRLRGGQPARVVVLDRSFREVTTGRFQTWAAVPGRGAHELVLTTGIGGMSTCFRFDIEGDEVTAKASRPVVTIQMLTEPSATARNEHLLRLRLVNEAGAPISPIDPRLVVSSLDFGWRQTLTPIGSVGDEALSFLVIPPGPGLYALSIDDRVTAGADVQTTILDVKP